MSNLKLKMSNKRKKCQLLQNLYSTFLLNSKKGKNVDFSKFLFDIFSSIPKKGKNVEQFEIYVFDIFS